MKNAGSREECMAQLGVTEFSELKQTIVDFEVVRDSIGDFLEQNNLKGLE